MQRHLLDAPGLDELTAMNLLQDNGIVSNLALWFSDVSAVDQVRAIQWLKERQKSR